MGRGLRRRRTDAIEEIVRWASPVIYMRRTLTRDTVLGGVDTMEGDKVALWYAFTPGRPSAA